MPFCRSLGGHDGAVDIRHSSTNGMRGRVLEREPNHLLPDHDLRPTYALIEVSQCGRRDFAYQEEE